MGEKTAISWTDATWNPWVGCTKISAGCKNCYMYTQQARWGKDPSVVRRTLPATFNAPLHWTPSKIFTCSLSDFFIPEADAWRGDAWDVIMKTLQHTYLILTKRPHDARVRMPIGWRSGWPHVWLGVTVENNETRGRYFDLLQIPAVVRFLSVEPMLGPVDLSLYMVKPDWVICGAESGPNRREMKPQWAIELMNQCQKYGIPFFYKQGSALFPGQNDLLDGKQYHQFPKLV